MRRWFGGMVVVLLTFYLAIIYENRAMVLLGWAEIAGLLFALGSLCLRVGRLQAGLEIPISLGELGKPVSIHVKLCNRSKSSMYRVKLCMTYGRASGRRKKRWFEAEEVIVGEGVQKLLVELKEPGAYEFYLEKLKIYDCFGIFFWKKRVKDAKKVIVLPEIQEVSVTLGASVVNFFGDSEVYDELRPGYDPAETFDIREFRQGDRIQSVHWKLSARTDELMVRENSLPKACALVLFLEEEALEWAMSLSFALVEQKCPHFVAWNSESMGELVRMRIEDEESFYRAFTMLLSDRRGDAKGAEGIVQAYDEKYPGEIYVHTLYFKDKRRLYVDEELHLLTSYEDFELIL